MAVQREHGSNACGRRTSSFVTLVGVLGLLSCLGCAPAHTDAATPSAAAARGVPSKECRRRRQRRPFERPSLILPSVDGIASSRQSDCELLKQLRGGGIQATAANYDATSPSLGRDIRGGEAEISTNESDLRKKVLQTITASAVAILAVLSVHHWDTIRTHLSAFFDREKFRAAIIDNLNSIASQGDKGLFLYSLGFIPYEACGLPTSVVETAAGMAFGFKRGLLGSFVGKTCGSVAAFTLGRTLLSDFVEKKMADGNSNLELIERGVARNPMLSALVVRYSPFPQLLKNFALSLTRPVTYPMFALAVTIHGLPFSVLWAALGEDSALRLRASEAGEDMQANVVLNGLLVFVTIFGFVISPLVTGWWLADLRRGQEASN